MRNLLKVGCLLSMLAVVLGSCNVTRHLPEGSYLLQKVEVQPDKSTPKAERVTQDEVMPYIRQSRNKRFLGTNFYVWVYQLANPEKKNKWNNFKRRIGQQPVLVSQEQTEKSAENLKIYMDARGFFNSKVDFDIDTLRRKKRAYVTYSLRQGEPYRLDTISYQFRDKFLEQIVLPDTANTLLHSGDVFDINVLNRERERIAGFLRDRGYFNFTVNNIEYLADTLIGNHKVNLEMIIKQNITGYDTKGQPVMDNNVIYRLDRINIFPNFDPKIAATDSAYLSRLDTVIYKGLNIIYDKRRNVTPASLRQSIPLNISYVYNASQIKNTYQRLMSLGYFKSSKIVFEESPRNTLYENYVTYVGDGDKVDSTQIQYAKEGYLNCNILCTPQLKQSYKVELEASATSSFYGLLATVGYQNRNLFRGMESFDVSFTAGYEFLTAPDAKKKNALELGAKVGLNMPRIIFPFYNKRYRDWQVNPRTRIELSFNYQDRPYYVRTLSSVSWGYSWNTRGFSSLVIRPIDINLIDVSYIDPTFKNKLDNKYLVESYESQLILGHSGSYTFNNQMKNLGGSATLLRVSWDLSGNIARGLESLFGKKVAGHDYYEIFGIQFSQYVRGDVNLSHKFALGGDFAIATRLFVGAGLAYGNSNILPIDRMFFVGGSNSMRGWVARTLGPGASTIVASAYPSQVGDMRLEANFELRFPIWDILKGAVFLDAGNVWFLRANNEKYAPNSVFYFDNFYRELGFNTGVGLRLDIKFAVLRLDWGIQLHNPNQPAGQRWVIDNFKLKNTALNFGVGYPF